MVKKKTEEDKDNGKGKDKKETPSKTSKSLTKSNKTLTNQDIEKLVVELAQKGTSPSKIGIILRDSYGVPKIKLKVEKVSKILKKNDLKTLADLDDLVKKAIQLRKHREKNKQDQVAKRGLLLTEAKISKLSKYYKKKGFLPKDWKYRERK